MKSILNNPWVVATLAVSAISVCGWNIVRPLVVDADQAADAAAVDSAVASIGEAADSIANLGGAVGWTSDGSKELSDGLRQLGFNASWHRDPFRFDDTTDGTASVVTELAREPQGQPSIPGRATAISAVVVGQGFQIAVVDGKVVRRGEQVEAGTIGTISPVGVEVVAADQAAQVIAIPRTR